MSTTSPCCWCDPLPCRQALDRSQSQSKLRCSPCIGKKLATDPGILLSFLPSEKPQKRRKRSHTNVSNTLVARPLTPPAQTPQRSFQQASAGVLLSSANRLICLKYAEGAPHTAWESPLRSGFKSHSHKRLTFVFTGESGYTLAFTNRIAHSGLHGETGGISDGGGITTLGAFCAVRKPCVAGYQNGKLCRFLALVRCAPEERGEPSEQRCAHARRCSEASRPRWAA